MEPWFFYVGSVAIKMIALMGKILANFFHGCFVIVMFEFITMGLPNTTHQVPPPVLGYSFIDPTPTLLQYTNTSLA